jgi:hypothetical protein
MGSLSLGRGRRPAVLLIGVVLLLALALAPDALAAPSVVNGSFETDQFGFSGTLDLGGTNPLTGWTTGHNGTYPWGLPNSNSYNAGPTPYGNQWVIVGNYGAGGTYIQQDVGGFTVGQRYTLSFALASENVGEQAPVEVSFPSGSITASQTFHAPKRVANYWDTWQTFSMDFVAISSNVTIRLAGLAGGDAGIDNVSVVAVPKHPTSTAVSCTPNPVTVSKVTTCKVTVTDTNSGAKSTPTGSVSLSASGTGTLSPATCTLAAVSTGVASCSVTYKTSSVGSGTRTISASYPGDSGHAASNGSTVLTVNAVKSPAAAKCVAPKLKGKTLRQARKLLRKHHCRLGKVKTKSGANNRTGKLHVVSQSIKAHTVRKNGKRVSVVLDRTGKPVVKLLCEFGFPDLC